MHKKQSGGAGQYAHVTGLIEPLPSHQNTSTEFVDKTVGTNVPKQFVPGVEKGIYKSIITIHIIVVLLTILIPIGFRIMTEKGLLSGHRIAGVKFILIDGGHHIVDSSELAFNLAAQGAVKQGITLNYCHIK